MNSIIVLSAWLLAIVALSARNRRTVGGRRLSLMRALFPSWRFFDRLEQVPKVFFRSRLHGGDFGPWTALFLPSPRPLRSLILNPQGNLEFAYHSLVELAVSDLNESRDAAEFSESVSMKLLVRMVRSVLTEKHRLPASSEFQFKISIIDTRTREPSGDLLESALYPLKEGSSV